MKVSNQGHDYNLEQTKLHFQASGIHFKAHGGGTMNTDNSICQIKTGLDISFSF